MGGKLTPSKREQIINSSNSKRHDDILVAYELPANLECALLDSLVQLYPPPKEENHGA